MSADINFSDLWHGQSAPAPGVDELIGKAKRLRSKTRNKLIALSLLLAATAAFIVWVGAHYHPQFVTTIAGIVLVLIAIAMSIVYNTGSIRLLMQNNAATSVQEQLEQLIRLKQKQEYMQRVILTLYFVILSAGLALYMIEYTLQMPLPGAIAAYAVTAAWILFNWFYIRPRTIKKQQDQLHKLITEFERIQSQFKE